MSLAWPPPGTRPLPIDVVSVQSQVVYGRVGNNVALPTLGAYGLSVAAVPTVLLGNTPHYATMHGGAMPDDWFAGWLDDLRERDSLAGLRAILGGYLGGAGQARVLARWIRARLDERPELRVVIDPVIGDHDHGVYVDPALVEVYRQELLLLADIVTPNGFELAHLSGQAVDDAEGTVAAARKLLDGRTRWVAVTSAARDAWPEGSMRVVLVSRDEAFAITHPRIDAEPKGTGDMFAANLVGGWLAGDKLSDAAAKACARVIQALRRTREARCAELLLPDAGMAAAERAEVHVRAL